MPAAFAAADPTLTVKNLTGRLGIRNDDLNVEKLTLQTADSTATIDGIVANSIARVTPPVARVAKKPGFC